MSAPIVRRLSLLLFATIVTATAIPGCTKRIDTSTEAKLYRSWTEVMNSLPESRRREFDEGMSMIWFYSNSDEETNALIDGKSGKEILALVEEMKASLPKVDTSSKEAFDDSLAAIRKSLPESQIPVYEQWVKELPSYRPGHPAIESLNGKMFHKIVENRDIGHGSSGQ